MDHFVLRYDVFFVDVLYWITEFFFFLFFLCMDAKLFWKKKGKLFSSRLAKKNYN